MSCCGGRARRPLAVAKPVVRKPVPSPSVSGNNSFFDKLRVKDPKDEDKK